MIRLLSVIIFFVLVYIDDGLDNDAFIPYANGDSLTWDTSTMGQALTAGLTYRLKYSASNVAGEGLRSPEVSILLAEKPSAPANLRRIGT